MIPQKLHIKNFLSYGPNLQTIDFSHYSLICLSGKNGHGKSALLDAITWALWGQARKTSATAKADQGLLRLGQTQMLVIFDFIFGGKEYRIRREYMETYGKPVNILEFGMIDPQTETLIPLTDKTIRTTQEKIEQTLRLDFDSFSNSAFLRQGNSNEFSKKSAKDRKQILASILGLDQYEVVRKLAMEKVKDAFNKKTVLLALQEKRTQELATQETLTAQLAQLETEMLAISRSEQILTQEQTHHKQQCAVYDEKQKQHTQLTFHIQQLIDQKKIHEQQLIELVAHWRTVNRKKQSLGNIHHLEQEKKKLIAAITQHQKLLQENLEHRQALLTLTQQLNSIEQQYKDEQTKKSHALQLELERLHAEQKNAQTTVHAHQQQSAQLHADNTHTMQQIAANQKEVALITHNTQQCAQAEAHLEKRKAAYQHFVSLGNWISSELQSLLNKKKLVHEDDPSCPLCEQNLSASRKRFLKGNFEKQESFLSHRLQRLKRIIPALKELLIAQHAAITKDKEQLQHAAQLQTKITDLHATRIKVEQQIKQLTDAITSADTHINARARDIALKQHDITTHAQTPLTINDALYKQLTQQKQQLEQQLHTHVYREDEYKKDHEQLKQVELQLQEYQAFQQDNAQQEMRKNDISKLCDALKIIKQKKQTLEQKSCQYGDMHQQLEILHQHEKDLELKRAQLNNAKELLLEQKGSIENQHKHLAKIKKEFEQEQHHITQLDMLIDDYQAIATATGKDGIQALLIEEAIPEIEQEANVLLSRLTNNQAQIFIESLRDLKKGGTKETLDIKISDQAGIRPYELFSGGEAFRIDFALRIAISKLLARRAGTALQTLIIDEGFGSQDDEGLSHIMDALHVIQNNFSKIIVVSHLPAMKDQFPVQFMIHKGVQGSTITVVEQG